MKLFLQTLSLFCLFSLFTSSLAAEVEDSEQRQKTYKNLEIFSNVLTLLQQHYVEDIDTQEVIEGAVRGMLMSLDPHSSYMKPEDFKELQEETRGSFSGIGIEITLRDGRLTIVSPIEGTPAFEKGLEAGDQIIAIEGEPTKNMSLMDAVKKLRGEKGSSVVISVHRKSWQQLHDITIVRDVIPLHSVRSEFLEDGFAYIRISNFQANTNRDFIEALKKLSDEQTINGLIFDLRNNPGGLLDQAVKIADVFLDQGMIVSTRGRNPEQTSSFEAHSGDDYLGFPIVLLVNGGSASASEIVAGALQDHGRAIILGTETFGKGSVQSIIPMPDGAGLRLTTAKYYTPSGDSIQATGISPDIRVQFKSPPKPGEKKNKLHAPLRERNLPNHFENEENGKESAKKKTGKEKEEKSPADELHERLQKDNQLQTGLIILKSLRIAGNQETGEKKE